MHPSFCLRRVIPAPMNRSSTKIPEMNNTATLALFLTGQPISTDYRIWTISRPT